MNLACTDRWTDRLPSLLERGIQGGFFPLDPESPLDTIVNSQAAACSKPISLTVNHVCGLLILMKRQDVLLPKTWNRLHRRGRNRWTCSLCVKESLYYFGSMNTLKMTWNRISTSSFQQTTMTLYPPSRLPPATNHCSIINDCSTRGDSIIDLTTGLLRHPF
jgi:hypothetical protein